jgi:hypothetical protein
MVYPRQTRSQMIYKKCLHKKKSLLCNMFNIREKRQFKDRKKNQQQQNNKNKKTKWIALSQMKANCLLLET